jgi:hypothetical protein
MLGLFKRKENDLRTAGSLDAGSPKGRVFLIIDPNLVAERNNFNIALRCTYAFAMGCLDKGYHVGAVAKDMFFDLTSNRKEIRKVAQIGEYACSGISEFEMIVAAVHLLKPVISFNPLHPMEAHSITSGHFDNNCIDQEAMKKLLWYQWRPCTPTPFKLGEAKSVIVKQRKKCFREQPNKDSNNHIVLVSDFSSYMKGGVSVCGYCLKEQGVNLSALKLPFSQKEPPDPFSMIGNGGRESKNSCHALSSVSHVLTFLS